jgi:hypothetical protein
MGTVLVGPAFPISGIAINFNETSFHANIFPIGRYYNEGKVENIFVANYKKEIF